jgi:hypothetical protein
MNYLLGTNQHPNIFEKVTIILGNYQGAMPSQPGGDQRNEGGGLAFIQRGAIWQGCGAGQSAVSRGRIDRAQDTATRDAKDGGNNTSVSTLSTQSGQRTNSAGESHCFHCGVDDHWAKECPLLLMEYWGVEQEEDAAINFCTSACCRQTNCQMIKLTLMAAEQAQRSKPRITSTTSGG